MAIHIPQMDPRAGYLAHREEIDAAIAATLAGGRYILGDEVAAFEREFAAFLGARHAVGVANGTDALHLALRAIGIGPGDRVATVSHTASATAAAIELAGAAPVFADIDPATFTLDPASLAAVLRKPGPRIRAVIPVHLYGHPCDMGVIVDLASKYELAVIEDCAQAHGSAIGATMAGTFGTIAAFSFYPTKNLGALGDGGAVVTGDPALAERVRALREYGWQARYVSETAGMNSRLDELQAAILRVKLRHLAPENARRRELASQYGRLLATASLTLPRAAPGIVHAFHQYVIRSADRDSLRNFLAERGVGTLVHYPVPVHLQPAYRERIPLVVPLPQTEAAANAVLSLPMYPQCPPGDIDFVCHQIAEQRTGAASR